ncbi:MAG: endo alpha-1,4 polygalactosaminidase [bacterium]|nr:endo alpha-1,4 polygalactosaminidase [bacterium]
MSLSSTPLLSQERSTSFIPIRNFVYQLQDVDFSAMGQAGFNLAIIDYSADGTDQAAFSRGRVDSLRSAPAGPSIVLAYLSIGEAEDYRFYWQAGWTPGNPSWLGRENPDWEGNYRVAYWDSGWRDIVLRYLEKIQDAGFDGVYCDLVDQYEYFMERGRSTAAEEMADLVAAIREAGRIRDPDFLVFVQNASELPGLVPSYLETVDGIGQEDIYYGYERDGVATPSEVTSRLEASLAVFRDAGKTVLTVDYPFSLSENRPHFDSSTRLKIDRAYERSASNGFIPYCTVRELNYMTVNPGHEPSAVRNPEASVSPRPESPALFPNFPNPFNGGTVIPVSLSRPVRATLSVFDVRGAETVRIHQGTVRAGRTEFLWDGNGADGGPASSGVYFAVLETAGNRETVKLLLVR